MEFISESTLPVISTALDKGRRVISAKSISGALKGAGKTAVLAVAGIGLYGLVTGNSVNELYNKIMNGLDKVKLKGLFEKVVDKFGKEWGPKIFTFLVMGAVAELLVVAYNKVVAKKIIGESVEGIFESEGNAGVDMSLLKRAVLGAGKAASVIFPAIKVKEDGTFTVQIRGLKLSEYAKLFVFGMAFGVISAGIYISKKNNVSVKDGIKGALVGAMEFIKTHKTSAGVVCVACVMFIFLFKGKLPFLKKDKAEG